ncbi:MAG: helix-turn-helix transcriptional regulator [Atopobiaceae bacterium]|jgi:DNA-binding HxlR family transcriptional regulator|nr:helix-turn-helix transcriptional regulator [Atopobiaceae bacterium]MCI1388676.1 helix-turn-helix transcriptional regulator [Atopobiaceae bacterium]MCI1432704.1 helix-turn-helix transcriptional regulator [Atopobiaceae bacterium]MCI1470959.1 helix-turn-helix transcriptional regulator [Atopobiaceae bacterium]
MAPVDAPASASAASSPESPAARLPREATERMPCFASADPSVTGAGCSLRRVLDAVGGKWKILLLVALSQADELRYGELRRLVFGITNTMLATSLKELEADGLVLRTQYPEMPVRVEYRLTDRGRSLIPILMELKDWGDENL